jgi:hypothetical protein
MHQIVKSQTIFKVINAKVYDIVSPLWVCIRGMEMLISVLHLNICHPHKQDWSKWYI